MESSSWAFGPPGSSIGVTGYGGGTNLDANALLTDLDRGLRSTRPGEVCEAIVRFPWLIRRYPFPILINSAALKLVEVFKTGTNFSRVLILKVMQESEKHLEKIVNVDEFVRRLFAVTYSNDPVARSLTLRALASIADIVSDRKNIQHCLRISLESKDAVELNAAIEACANFARKSPSFAASIYPKIMSMIQNPETQLETKVALLSIFNHKHFAGTQANDIRRHLIELLNSLSSPSSRNEKLVIAILDCLTEIASTCISQVTDQIKLLVEHMEMKTTKLIRRAAVRNLIKLAQTNPHLWERDTITKFLNLIDQVNDKMAYQILTILSHLLNSPLVFSIDPTSVQIFEVKLLNYSLTILYSGTRDALLVFGAVELLTDLCVKNKRQEDHFISSVSYALQALLFTLHENFTDQASRLRVKRVLESIKSFCIKFPDASLCIIDSLKMLLMEEELVKEHSAYLQYVALTLCALNGSVSFKLFWIKEELFQCLKCQLSVKKNGNEDEEDEDSRSSSTATVSSLSSTKSCNQHLLLSCYVLLFQHLCQTNTKLTNDEIQEIITGLKGQDLWFIYKLLREGMRFGQEYAVAELNQKLVKNVSAESQYFWTVTLCKMNEAERILSGDAEPLGDSPTSSNRTSGKVKKAIALYNDALSAMRASSTASCIQNETQGFRSEYIRLRAKYLEAHEALRLACGSAKFCPPAALAPSMASMARDELLKFGSLVIQMRKCGKQFRHLSECYANLYERSFNADSVTLAHLQLIQYSCIIAADTIDNLFLTNFNQLLVGNNASVPYSEMIQSQLDGAPVELRQSIQICHQISKISQTQMKLTNDTVPQVIKLVKDLSSDLLSIPLCVPRYFFQSVQSTCVKLAVSPQPKAGSELITVPAHSGFALKIEGVVVDIKESMMASNQTSRRKPVRRVAKVFLHVNCSYTPKTAIPEQAMMLKPVPDVNLSQYVEPHNEYFETQFLINFATSGIHMITVDVAVIDDQGVTWKTGPTTSLSVKAMEEKI